VVRPFPSPLLAKQLCVSVKRRVLVVGWNGAFVPRREVTLAESPRAMLANAHACIVALRCVCVCVNKG
jgi:hypothetical protein